MYSETKKLSLGNQDETRAVGSEVANAMTCPKPYSFSSSDGAAVTDSENLMSAKFIEVDCGQDETAEGGRCFSLPRVCRITSCRERLSKVVNSIRYTIGHTCEG